MENEKQQGQIKAMAERVTRLEEQNRDLWEVIKGQQEALGLLGTAVASQHKAIELMAPKEQPARAANATLTVN